jgi:hypothetical protein
MAALINFLAADRDEMKSAANIAKDIIFEKDKTPKSYVLRK